jgi:hypothetical protein
MMNAQMGGWYSGMASGNWMFEIVILIVVIVGAVAVIVSRKK